MTEHYKKVRVNPEHKTLIFSDGLTVDSAVLIAEHCKGRVGTSFGIGTHLTNDVGVKPLNIVIKATWFETERTGRVPVCKLSDDPGKVSGDPKAIENAKYELGIMP
jgi:nicotinate phosphoribosyltransferase